MWITRPIHFVYPILFILIGGLVFRMEGQVWTYAGILIWVLAGVQALWLFLDGITTSIDRITSLIKQSENWYRTIASLSDEERMLAGLEPVPDSLKITTKVSDTHWHFDYLDVPPFRLRQMARLLAVGKPFTIRALSGDGKPLSDKEWRYLKDEFLNKGWIIARSNDPRQGFVITETGEEIFRRMAN